MTSRTGFAVAGKGAFLVIKAEIPDPLAERFVFVAQKTMYGGKHARPGDLVYLFASENEGGQGLVAQGVVERCEAVARRPGPARQTPGVSLVVRRISSARHPLGRRQLRPFNDWGDGQPATELNFKLYRQATDKLVGISEEAAAYLDRFF